MNAHLPDGYLARPAALADAEKVVELFNDEAFELNRQRKFDVESQRNEWQTPGYDLKESTRLAITPEGEIAGYYEIWDTTP